MTTVRLKTKKTSQNRVTVTFVTKCDVRGQRSTNSPPRRGATRGVGESLPGLDRCGCVGDLRWVAIRGCTRQIRELPIARLLSTVSVSVPSVRSSRMTPETLRSLVDAQRVFGNRLARPTFRHDVIPIVLLRPIKVIDHQVATVPLDGR